MAYNQAAAPRSGPGPRWGNEAPSLPEGYLAGGYYLPSAEDGGEELDPRYIIEYPRKIAQSLYDREMNKSAQLRKFFDYCIRLRDITAYRGQSFSAVRAELDRLVPFVEYAQSRRRVSPLFVEFIVKNLQAIQSQRDFYAFLKHFEALIAYRAGEQR